ncbi:unnamed protein product, partial [Meganyctiphanes norvegica]
YFPVENPKATKIIQKEHVKSALRADKGSDAVLRSWKAIPFTKKGDGYAGYVTCVIVKYGLGCALKEVTYVVKVNPCGFGFYGDRLALIFEKEVKFYTKLLLDLNSELESVGQDPLKFPKCYYASLEKDKEIFFLEDLRPLGYKMADMNQKGLDICHTKLVIKESGRLHAASKLLTEKISNEEFKLKYDFLLEEGFVSSQFSENLTFITDFLDTSGGYDNVRKWVTYLKSNAKELLEDQRGSSPPFDVVCHGDLITNNLLFRYDDDNKPIDVIFIDLQLNRFASAALDLEKLLFLSVDTATRNSNLDEILSIYYKSFLEVLSYANNSIEIPYTKDEFKEEFKKKNPFGMLWGMFGMPSIISNTDDLLDFQSVPEDKWEQVMAEFGSNLSEKLKTNPLLKPRLLDLLDEINQCERIGSYCK